MEDPLSAMRSFVSHGRATLQPTIAIYPRLKLQISTTGLPASPECRFWVGAYPTASTSCSQTCFKDRYDACRNTSNLVPVSVSDVPVFADEEMSQIPMPSHLVERFRPALKNATLYFGSLITAPGVVSGCVAPLHGDTYVHTAVLMGRNEYDQLRNSVDTSPRLDSATAFDSAYCDLDTRSITIRRGAITDEQGALTGYEFEVQWAKAPDLSAHPPRSLYSTFSWQNQHWEYQPHLPGLGGSAGSGAGITHEQAVPTTASAISDVPAITFTQYTGPADTASQEVSQVEYEYSSRYQSPAAPDTTWCQAPTDNPQMSDAQQMLQVPETDSFGHIIQRGRIDNASRD
ncbi:hypothetical protein I317_00715 [Kwoniella heveanensis CBS 569]|nr:hypothetical protein I317_00715 [Kwoniella heveanensis CBS 569]